jgi:hypothetical protein
LPEPDSENFCKMFLICSFVCGIKIKSTGQMGPETEPAKRDSLWRVFAFRGWVRPANTGGISDEKATMLSG